jgi:hypothetical protein
MWLRLARAFEMALLIFAGALVLSYSAPRPHSEQDRARAFTREIEFEYLSWMLDAVSLKAQAGAIGTPGLLDRENSRIAVADYLQITARLMRAEDALQRLYADPTVQDKEGASRAIRASVEQLHRHQIEVAPLAEAVLQAQVTEVAAGLGLTFLGQPMPAVLFRTTSVPDALIVSPRTEIRQLANVSILADLPLEDQVNLEGQVERALDASALVVPVGGVGVYPTMIMQTTDRRWLTSTIAHEWMHNYLIFRPLGILYDHTPELRTMNETTADIVGSEVGDEVLRRYYPAISSAPMSDWLVGGLWKHRGPLPARDPPPFDFRAEMHSTRIAVDAMLASGRIVEAENYMERRRRTFLENGYFIRRLNQAYFAFYGAYAAVPGGAAGEDPVGPAVRTLRARSRSLAEFVKRIAWMTSFEELKAAVGQTE